MGYLDMTNFTLDPKFLNNSNLMAPVVDTESIIRDYLTGIDNFFTWSLALIFILYFLSNIFLPRAKIGLMEMKKIFQSKESTKSIIPMIDLSIFIVERVASFSETCQLGCATYLMVITWIGGKFSTTQKTLLITCLCTTVVVMVLVAIGFFRNGGLKKILSGEIFGGKNFESNKIC